MIAPSCSSPSDIAVIQTAYEREASTGSTLHDNNADGFLCEITFVSKSDPTERLYFDIVSVARAGDTWELKSGLCKR
jgi:hypothetical protein